MITDAQCGHVFPDRLGELVSTAMPVYSLASVISSSNLRTVLQLRMVID
jgi:hypothetical protein